MNPQETQRREKYKIEREKNIEAILKDFYIKFKRIGDDFHFRGYIARYEKRMEYRLIKDNEVIFSSRSHERLRDYIWRAIRITDLF